MCRGARPHRHRRPARGVRRAAGPGPEAARRRGNRGGPKDRRHLRGGAEPARRRPAGLRLPARRDGRQRPPSDLDAAAGAATGRGRGGLRAGAGHRHGRGRDHARRRARRASRWRCRRWRSWTRGSRTGTSCSPTRSPTTPRAGSTSSVARAGSSTTSSHATSRCRSRINGEVRSSGNGAACLGDPLEALRWLAVQCAPVRRPVAGRPPRPVRCAGTLRPVRARRRGGGVHQRVRDTHGRV